jgi:hypothetical protein
MSWIPNDEWYKDLFNNCKTKADVIEKSTQMIRSRDKELCGLEEKTVTIAQGNVATIETLLNQMY